MTPVPDNDPRHPKRRVPVRRPLPAVWIGVGLFALVIVFNLVNQALQGGEALKYSEFKSYVEQGRVSEAVIGAESIHGKYLDSSDKEKTFTTSAWKTPTGQAVDGAEGQVPGRGRDPLDHRPQLGPAIVPLVGL
jgi:hypothetical protein